MSKAYEAFDPSMVGKVVSITAPQTNAMGSVEMVSVGKLSHYTTRSDGTAFYTLAGWGDGDAQLHPGGTIEVHNWAEPNDSLAEIATALTGMLRNQA